MRDYDAIIEDIQKSDYRNDELRQIACTLIQYNKELTSDLEKERWRSDKIIPHLEDCLYEYMEAFQDQTRRAKSIQEALSCLRLYVSKTLDCLENTDNLVKDFQQTSEYLVSRIKPRNNSDNSPGRRRQRSREQDNGRKSPGENKSRTPRNRGYLSSDNENENPSKRLKSSASTTPPRRYKRGRPPSESSKKRNSQSPIPVHTVSVDEDSCENFAAVRAGPFARLNGSEHLSESDIEIFRKLNDVSLDESSQRFVESNRTLGLGNNSENDEIEHEPAFQDSERMQKSSRTNVLPQASSSHKHSANCNHHVEFNESPFQEISSVKRLSKSPKRTSGASSSQIRWEGESTASESNAFSSNAFFSSEEEEFSTEDEGSQTCTAVEETESELPYQEIFCAQSTRKRKSRRRRSSRGRRRTSSVAARDSFKRNTSFYSGDGNYHNTQKGDQLFVVLQDFLKSPSEKMPQIHQETFNSGFDSFGTAASHTENNDTIQLQVEGDNGNEGVDSATVLQESSDLMPEDTPYSGSITDSCTIAQTESSAEENQLSEVPDSANIDISVRVTSPDMKPETSTNKRPRGKPSSKNITKGSLTEVNDEADQSPLTVDMNNVHNDGSAHGGSGGTNVAIEKKLLSEPFSENLPEDSPIEDSQSCEIQSSVGDSNVCTEGSCDQTISSSIGESSSFVNLVNSDNLTDEGSSVISQREHDILVQDAASQDTFPDATSKTEEETPNSVGDGKMCDENVADEKINLEKSKPVSKTGRPRGRPPKRRPPSGNVSTNSSNLNQSNQSEENMALEMDKDANDEKLPDRSRHVRKRKFRELQSDFSVESSLPEEEIHNFDENSLCDGAESGNVISEDLRPTISRRKLREKKSKEASVPNKASAKSMFLVTPDNENAVAVDSEADGTLNFNSGCSTANHGIEKLENVNETEAEENSVSADQRFKAREKEKKKKMRERRNASEKSEPQNTASNPDEKSEPLTPDNLSDQAELGMKGISDETVPSSVECQKPEASKRRGRKTLGLGKQSLKSSLLRSHRSSPRHKEPEASEVESKNVYFTDDSAIAKCVDSADLFDDSELTEENTSSKKDVKTGAGSSNSGGKKGLVSVSQSTKKPESASNHDLVPSPVNETQQTEAEKRLFDVPAVDDLGSKANSSVGFVDSSSSGSKLESKKKTLRTRRGKAGSKQSSKKPEASYNPTPKHTLLKEAHCDNSDDDNAGKRTETDFQELNSDSLDLLESLKTRGREFSPRDEQEKADDNLSNLKSESSESALVGSSQLEESKFDEEASEELEGNVFNAGDGDPVESSNCVDQIATCNPSSFTMNLRKRQISVDVAQSRLNILSSLVPEEDKPDSLDTDHSVDRNRENSPYDPGEDIAKALGFTSLVPDSEESEIEEGEIVDDDETQVTPSHSLGIDIVEDSCYATDVTLVDKSKENDPSSEYDEEYVAVDEADEEESDNCKEDPPSSSPSR